MKKSVLGITAAGLIAGTALIGAPAQAATSNVTVQVKLVDSSLLASDGVPASKTACVTEDGPAAGATLKTPIVFKDKNGKAIATGAITKVSLSYVGGDFAGFFTCTVSGVVKVDTAKAKTVTIGKTKPIKINGGTIASNKGFVKVELAAIEE